MEHTTKFNIATTEMPDSVIASMNILPVIMGGWRKNALCRGMNSGTFNNIINRLPSEGARETCFSCPVQRECLTEGIQEKDLVWGGLSRKERIRWAELHDKIS
jgi:hypothetical protein